MRKLLCPQCKIASLYVKDDDGNRMPVYVNAEKEIIPKNETDSIEGFNTDEVFCFGCSWHGSVNKLVKY